MGRDYVRDDQGRFAETEGDGSNGEKSKDSGKLRSAMNREQAAADKIRSLQKNGETWWTSKEYESAAKEYKSAVRARQKATRETVKVIQQNKEKITQISNKIEVNQKRISHLSKKLGK